MPISVRYILFAFVIVTMLKEGNSQLIDTLLTVAETVIDPFAPIVKYFFPKDVGIKRVRNMDEAESFEDMGDTVVLDFIGMVEQYGYPAEQHKVTTEDGYKLKIHRIPGSPLRENEEKKNIVFFQHGMLCSSECWVIFGPGKDLAFLLADQGYDVWLGNTRGNSYSRSHVNMTVYDREFWQYSFHEAATIDLPTVLDYILDYTGQEDMHYIGHSMGTTISLILLSMKPEYNAKIKLVSLLAPIAFWKDVRPTFRTITYTMPAVKPFLANYGVYDALAQCASIINYCKDAAETQSVCSSLLFSIGGYDPPQLNKTALPYLFSHFPAGTSVKTLYHYYQNMFYDKFQSFDYGATDNYAHYKQETPIRYNLTNVIAPVALYHAPNDGIVQKKNVLELMKYLSNVVVMYEVQNKLFSHVDLIWAIDAKTLLFDYMIKLLHKYDTK